MTKDEGVEFQNDAILLEALIEASTRPFCSLLLTLKLAKQKEIQNEKNNKM